MPAKPLPGPTWTECESWLAQQAADCADSWYRQQCADPHAGLYLYYLPSIGSTWGRVVVAEVPPDTGSLPWSLGSGRIGPHMMLATARILIREAMGRLPILATE